VTELKEQLSAAIERAKRTNKDLAKRDEQIITLKTDYASVREKLKLREEEVERLRQEVKSTSHKYNHTYQELQDTRKELSDARTNSDRLTRESEAVVENVNTWVQEQREGNSKIAAKLRDQNSSIASLEAEKEVLSESNERLKETNERLRMELEEKRIECEKNQAIRSHSAQQQVIIQQLRNRLNDIETELDSERGNRSATIDDLHNRLKVNVDTVQQLHTQLNQMSKENLRQRALLDREVAARKRLQMQLRVREQNIDSLKSELDTSKSSEREFRKNDSYGLIDTSYGNNNERSYSGPANRREKLGTAVTKELEKAGVSSPEALDKSYWIQRVGELSIQLQQSSEYWSQKVRELSSQVERT